MKDKLRTSDLAVAGERPEKQVGDDESHKSTPRFEETDAANEEERPVPLFPRDVAADFRGQWDSIQIGFVDDPRNAVERADELVAQVMKRLAETFARERDTLEKQLNQSESASTENLRVALTSYRSFFKRLLSL
jgi:hypothetical protein